MHINGNLGFPIKKQNHCFDKTEKLTQENLVVEGITLKSTSIISKESKFFQKNCLKKRHGFLRLASSHFTQKCGKFNSILFTKKSRYRFPLSSTDRLHHEKVARQAVQK